MALYRICLRGSEGTLVGAHEFEAKGDDAAMIIALRLGRACSDITDSFELWHDGCRVDLSVDDRVLSAERLRAEVEEIVAEVELQLLDSRCAIARSARLLAETDRLLAKTGRRRIARR